MGLICNPNRNSDWEVEKAVMASLTSDLERRIRKEVEERIREEVKKQCASEVARGVMQHKIEMAGGSPHRLREPQNTGPEAHKMAKQLEVSMNVPHASLTNPPSLLIRHRN